MNIPFKSKLSRYRNIENRNKAFSKLPDREKRREIAYDALMLIVNNEVEGSYGHYWDDRLTNIGNKSKDSKDLQNKLISRFQKRFSCSVCQRGLLMISRIRLGNSVGPDDEFDNGSEGSLCGSGFNMVSFHDLEIEYEGNRFGTPYLNNSTKKLANLCCNIICNGSFNKSDKTDYLVKWDIKVRRD